MTRRLIATLADGTQLVAEPDMKVPHGHQWLLISDTSAGQAMATLLDPGWREKGTTHGSPLLRSGWICIPHDEQVDRQLILLVDLFAHIRFTTPQLLQLTLKLGNEA